MLENDPNSWLALVFAGLMGLAILIYAVLDGYDLGVGLLLRRAEPDQRDVMIASIGPFWDANETWLVLGVGLLLVAFPSAHGIILSSLYIPVAIMLIGLILRGVAFDFRAKVAVAHKLRWDYAFHIGSLLATLSQGYMLGRYITGFDDSIGAIIFAVVSAIGVTAAYALIGACWLIMKTEGDLQLRAIVWARVSLLLTSIGLIAVSVVNPLVNGRIYEKWLSWPEILYLAPLPVLTFTLLLLTHKTLQRLPATNDRWCWLPFISVALVFVLSFIGLAYSFYPYVVPDQITLWQAASAPESLKFILIGTVIVMPAIMFYTIFAYRIFWGKATALKYY